MKYFLATLIIMITLPIVAQAEVRINEIAWMGVSTTNGQYGEWFELYNSGTESISLNEWKLYKSGGEKLVYTFSGTIAAGEYYIVERTTASIPDPVPGIRNESGTFGNGGFANTGEFLVLKDAQGNIIQNIDQQAGWLVGDASTKNTMQYNGNAWITAAPTPGTINSTTAIIVSENEEKPDSKEQELYTTEQGSNMGVRTKESQEKVVPLLVRARKDPHIDFTFPSTVYTGNVYDFIGAITLEYNTPTTGVFVWNMGDGNTIRLTENAPVRHTYRYSGTYTVTLSYYPNERYGKPVVWANKTISVVVPEISIRALDSTILEIKNMLATTIDLSYWVISTPEGSGAIPDMTVLAPNATIALSTRALQIGNLEHATLSTMNGVTVATTSLAATSTRQNNATTITRVLAVKKVQEPIVLEPVEQQERVATPVAPIKQNHTKNILIGVVVVIIMGSLLFLERFIGYQE